MWTTAPVLGSLWILPGARRVGILMFPLVSPGDPSGSCREPGSPWDRTISDMFGSGILRIPVVSTSYRAEILLFPLVSVLGSLRILQGARIPEGPHIFRQVSPGDPSGSYREPGSPLDRTISGRFG